MTIQRLQSAIAVVAVLAATVGSVAAQEGRLSLAERVARLEQQQDQNRSAPAGGSLELLNRVQDMQAELQTLRNLLEQQSFELEELKKRQRDQYVDLDSRIERLRAGGAAGETGGGDDALDLSAPRSTTGVPPAPVPTAPADPNQLRMEDAQAVDPYTGEPISGSDPATPASSANVPAPVSTGGDPALEYQTAFDALKQGRYAESAALFNAFMRQHPDHELADNAMYWLGESHYVTQNYQAALETFRGLIQRYPEGEKTADAELKIGYCLYELGQYADAELALSGVIQRYPDSTVARLAESRLRALALERR